MQSSECSEEEPKLYQVSQPLSAEIDASWGIRTQLRGILGESNSEGGQKGKVLRVSGIVRYGSEASQFRQLLKGWFTVGKGYSAESSPVTLTAIHPSS